MSLSETSLQPPMDDDRPHHANVDIESRRMWLIEAVLEVELQCTKIALQRSKLHIARLHCRRDSFWLQPRRRVKEEDVRFAAQHQIWKQHCATQEHSCHQPMSICMAELRRWQGVQRAAHEQKCLQLRIRRDAEEGDLQWRIFCARLEHDSHGLLSVAPLSSEQTRYCHMAASSQLQPRAKAKDPRMYTVVRAAAIGATRLPNGGAMGPASARATRGLVCGELCQSVTQLGFLLTRLFSAMTNDGSPTTASTSTTTGVILPSATKSRTTGVRPQGTSHGGARNTPGSNRTERSSSVDVPDSTITGTLEKRLPLFPMSMRLSSDCLSWLQSDRDAITQGRYVYYLVEEIDGKVVGDDAKQADGHTFHSSIAQLFASQAEISAATDVGVDFRVAVPNNFMNAGSYTQRELHFRPAAVEHLLAVRCLWPGLDAADQQVLRSCYTPRFSSHAPRLITLYGVLSNGPQSDHNDALDSLRRLRPLKQAELFELLRVYVVREPQPTAAVLALQRAPSAGLAQQASDGGVQLQHVYCPLISPPGTTPSSMQCYLLQLELSGADVDDLDTRKCNAGSSSLVDMCQNGSMRSAVQYCSSSQLKCTCFNPPSISQGTMQSIRANSEKAVALSANLSGRMEHEATVNANHPRRAEPA